MRIKEQIDRYITREGKIYYTYSNIGGSYENWESWESIFPSGKVNTSEARKYHLKRNPELTDFILVRSKDFFGYELYVSKEQLRKYGKLGTTANDEKEFSERQVTSRSIGLIL